MVTAAGDDEEGEKVARKRSKQRASAAAPVVSVVSVAPHAKPPPIDLGQLSDFGAALPSLQPRQFTHSPQQSSFSLTSPPSSPEGDWLGESAESELQEELIAREANAARVAEKQRAAFDTSSALPGALHGLDRAAASAAFIDVALRALDVHAQKNIGETEILVADVSERP